MRQLLETKLITGEWFCVRFSPDKTTGELFNVGVVFIDKDKKCHAKLIENTAIFEHLFGSLGVANIKFLLTVVAETLAENHYNISPSSHISYSSRQTAQGESIDEILTDLYHSMISLLQLPAEESECKNDFLDGIKHAITIVKNHSDWISVNDRLPEPYQNVLVFKNGKLNGEAVKYIAIGFIDDDGYWGYDDIFGNHLYEFKYTGMTNDLDGIEFWQPLPEQPKGVINES